MNDDPKKDDSAVILGDMAEAHEEQPGENSKQAPKSAEPKADSELSAP